MHQVNINLKHRPYSFEVEGENKWGEDHLEIANDDDLSKNTVFEKTGYTLSKFLSKDDCAKLRLNLQDIISSELKKITGKILNRDELLNYHEFLTNIEHLDFVKSVYKNNSEYGSGFKFELIKEFRDKIINKISEICGVEVTPKLKNAKHGRFYIRIARPQNDKSFFDNNPPHKDIYIDRLRNAVNIYFPVIGSNEKSSLGIIPYSHKWKENEIKKIITKSTIKGLSYTVPCITDTKHGGLNIIRPQANNNEVFLFSPYCIHGGAPNFSNNTRISMEVRFWRA